MTKKKEDKVVEKIDPDKEDTSFDFMELLKNPAVASLLECGKDIFKKEETDPNVCEITIKAPSEVVLKLFNIPERK